MQDQVIVAACILMSARKLKRYSCLSLACIQSRVCFGVTYRDTSDWNQMKKPRSIHISQWLYQS